MYQNNILNIKLMYSRSFCTFIQQNSAAIVKLQSFSKVE